MTGSAKEVRVSCPMDCPDLCRYIVTVEDGKITGLKGDPEHPVTRGVVCKKGKDLVKRGYHPDRLLSPLMKKNGGFVPVSYDEVLDTLALELPKIKAKHGNRAILNYTSDGYGGLKARIQTIFFNCFGGAVVPRGSLCWGAGIAAQKYDFGSPRGHDPDDLLDSDLIIVWGRNPKITNLHLYTRLKQARQRGARIIVIDPVRSETAKAFNEHIRIRPATDAALALAMASEIIKSGGADTHFIRQHVKGYKRFAAHVSGFDPEKASTVTGIPVKTVQMLARAYSEADKACIYIGFGLQRYRNGGNAVRAIDALGAITGRIGKKGCGINYAARAAAPFAYAIEKRSRKYITQSGSFPVGRLGRFLEQNRDIQAIFVAGGNPLNQSPDLKRTVDAFSRVPLKVVFDAFMTDTAQHADIVLPAASVFEQADIFITSMFSPVINYSTKAVEPPNGVMPEFEFYLNLARIMGMDRLGFSSSSDYLEQSVRPLLAELNLTFDQLKEPDRYARLKTSGVCWEDLQFETPSGKYELYSKTAQKEAGQALPQFIAPASGSSHFPLRLLTCHTKESLHSQGFAFIDGRPTVYLHPESACAAGIQQNEQVRVVGRHGQIGAVVCVTDDVDKNTAFMHQGWWHKSGAVNFLTDDLLSDMGEQAAFYDSFCRVEKA